MFVIKERSADSLLKEAKKLILQSKKNTQIVSSSSRNADVKINENKRNRENIRDYVKLSPREFMSWWITSTRAKRKASNILLHYMKFKFGADIPSDYRTLLKTTYKSSCANANTPRVIYSRSSSSSFVPFTFWSSWCSINIFCRSSHAVFHRWVKNHTEH